MERRTVLAGIASAGTIGVAGCSQVKSVGRDPPADVVEAFFRAFNNGEGDRMRELLHPDARSSFDQQAAEQLSAYFQFELDGIETVEKGDGDAVVRYDGELGGMFTSEDQEAMRIELRVHDGEWRIWKFN